MSLRLYLDDCANSNRLREILVGEPYHHLVRIPSDADLTGADDDEHFAYARQHNPIVITKNPADFELLHVQHPDHPGVFAIYQDNDPRDMSYADIARAIQNIINVGMPIADGFHILNRWRY